METVEVVIRIPKRTYDRVSERGIIAYGDDAYYIGHAIKNGTVLPKGHDDLISREGVLTKLHEYFDPLADGEDICPADIYHEINALSRVIAADKGEEE